MLKRSAFRDRLEEMHTAYIGMGSNLASWAGPPEATLAAAAWRLESIGRVVGRSSLYSTAPVGFAGAAAICECCCRLCDGARAAATARARCLRLSRSSDATGRQAFKNGPRTLDLDILLFADAQIDEPGLEIPHPRLAQRAFALIPLREIAPQASIARSGKTVTQLLHDLVPQLRRRMRCGGSDSMGWLARWRCAAAILAPAGLSGQSAQRSQPQSSHDHSRR